jgi:hypothetical protein
MKKRTELDFIKIKKLQISILLRNFEVSQRWEQKYVYDKLPVSRIHEEFLKLSNKIQTTEKENSLIKDQGKLFTKEDAWITNKHMQT